MKDRLESFISENRDSFDAYEPADHLWDNIRKREPAVHERRHSIRLIIYRVAAVIAIFLASWILHDYIDYQRRINSDNQSAQIYQMVPELKETENYYNNLVNEKMEELTPYFTTMPGLDHEVRSDLTELDSVYASLKKDLSDNIANDQVIEAMIQNYRMKLEILEDLLGELKLEQNPVHHEANGPTI